MKTNKPSLSLIVNAGGQSHRMGRSKALLPVPGVGLPLVLHIIGRLRHLVTGDVIIVANDPEIEQSLSGSVAARFVADSYPDLGPLGGIAAGLEAARDWGIVVACDMPLVRADVIQHLWQLAQQRDANGHASWDAVVPVANDYVQPLHAIYHRRCLPAVKARLATGELQAASFLADLRVLWVAEDELRPFDPDLESFVNVNTPTEWAYACALLARSDE